MPCTQVEDRFAASPCGAAAAPLRAARCGAGPAEKIPRQSRVWMQESRPPQAGFQRPKQRRWAARQLQPLRLPAVPRPAPVAQQAPSLRVVSLRAPERQRAAWQPLRPEAAPRRQRASQQQLPPEAWPLRRRQEDARQWQARPEAQQWEARSAAAARSAAGPAAMDGPAPQPPEPLPPEARCALQARPASPALPQSLPADADGALLLPLRASWPELL
jgi:hypothetical protein